VYFGQKYYSENQTLEPLYIWNHEYSLNWTCRRIFICRRPWKFASGLEIKLGRPCFVYLAQIQNESLHAKIANINTISFTVSWIKWEETEMARIELKYMHIPDEDTHTRKQVHISENFGWSIRFHYENELFDHYESLLGHVKLYIRLKRYHHNMQNELHLCTINQDAVKDKWTHCGQHCNGVGHSSFEMYTSNMILPTMGSLTLHLIVL